MPLKLTNYRYGTPRRRGEGLRIGATRFLPRGVPKQDYARLDYFDVWMPILAPSRELLQWYRDAERSADSFFARYRKEMARTESRQTILLLAETAKRTPIAVGCFCEDASRCHRTALERLIAQVGGL